MNPRTQTRSQRLATLKARRRALAQMLPSLTGYEKEQAFEEFDAVQCEIKRLVAQGK